jgi:hypothetical protein
MERKFCVCRSHGLRIEREGTYRQHVDPISVLSVLEKEKCAVVV